MFFLYVFIRDFGIFYVAQVVGMDKLEIRRATEEDKEAVLNIHDHVYDGHDYLPAYYDHFLSSKDFTPFVMIFDGKIVSVPKCHCLLPFFTSPQRSSWIVWFTLRTA